MSGERPIGEQSHKLPEQIGGYRIQRELGSGGMATVYAALQRRPRRIVAVKVIKAGRYDAMALRRFHREVEILGRLRHPFIAQVYEAGTYVENGEELPYLVMEYIPGAKTILEYTAAKTLSLRDRLKLFTKVCFAVEHGHRNKVIHRDLKPANILIDRSGEPKVIDFGVARAAEIRASSNTMETEAGRLVGTVQYMSPEQLETRPVDLDARCDVYALGVVLYKLMTGRLPHDVEGLPLFNAVQVIRQEAPKKPSSLKAELRGDLDAIILKALSFHRNDRYRHAGALGRDILRHLMDKPVHARAGGPMYRVSRALRRNRAAVAATGIAALLVIIAAGAFVWTQRSTTIDSSAELLEAGRISAPPSTPDELGPKPLREVVPDRAAQLMFQPFDLDEQGGDILDLAIDAGGKVFVSASKDHTVALWSFDDRSLKRLQEDHIAPVKFVAFANDGRMLVSVSTDGEVVITDPATGKRLHRFYVDCSGINAFTITRDGSRFACACDDFTARVIDIATEQEHVFRSSTGALLSVAFNRDGSKLAAGSQRDDVYVWDIETGEREAQLSALNGRIVAVGFTWDARAEAAEAAGVELLIGISESGRAVRWESQSSEPSPMLFNVSEHDIVAVSFEHSGRYIACASHNWVTITDLLAMKSVCQPQQQSVRVQSVALSSGAPWYAVGGYLGEVSVHPIVHQSDDAIE